MNERRNSRFTLERTLIFPWAVLKLTNRWLSRLCNFLITGPRLSVTQPR